MNHESEKGDDIMWKPVSVIAVAALALLLACGGEAPSTDSGVQSTAPGESSGGTTVETKRLPTKETGPARTGTLIAASIAAGSDGASLSDLGVSNMAMSADGGAMAIVSSSHNLVEGQHDVRLDSHLPELFLHDRESRGTLLVSHNLGDPTQTSIAQSDFPDVSADGRFVAYPSSSTDLVVMGEDRSLFHNQVFLYDREAGANVRMSNAAGGITASNGGSEAVSICADGRWVAYQSNAQNLVAGQQDRRGNDDIFLYDRVNGENIKVSHAPGSETAPADHQSIAPSISADGRWVAYVSYATNLVAGLNDTNGSGLDVFLYDRESGESMLVSRAGHSPTATGNNGCSPLPPSISDDGRFVVYNSTALDIVPGMVDTAADGMVYCFDRDTGENQLVSHAAGKPLVTGLGLSEAASISGDGNWVVFASEANDLVAGQDDAEVRRNIYLWERASNATRLVSHRAGSTLASPNQNSYESVISRDGRFIAFDSDAPHLAQGQVDEEMGLDCFLYDRDTAAITLVSHLPGSPTTANNGTPTDISISADGTVVGFICWGEEGLVPEDTNNQPDAYWFVVD